MKQDNPQPVVDPLEATHRRKRERVSAFPDYGPVHPCPLCGVEISLVDSSHGRRAWVEIATGLHHRWHCAGHDREVAAMLVKANAPEYMAERPAAPKPTRPPWSIR